jgi:hypothetical protein
MADPAGDVVVTRAFAFLQLRLNLPQLKAFLDWELARKEILRHPKGRGSNIRQI